MAFSKDGFEASHDVRNKPTATVSYPKSDIRMHIFSFSGGVFLNKGYTDVSPPLREL